MATKKITDFTATTTPLSSAVFPIVQSSSNLKVTLANIAANMPDLTATTITSSGALTVSGNATFSGDVTISGDDLFMATNTSGAALIADGTNFNPVVISGDISIGTTGTAAIGTGVIVNADVNTSAAIAFSKMENLTASRALVSDGSGDVSVSAVTSTEIGYLDGVSSSIQSQLDGKASSSYVPTAITVADESSDTTCFPLFTTAATGDLGPKTASGLTFNSNTDVLSGTFSGNITGDVTGNVSGTSGSTTGNAATATALATARNIGGVSFDGTGNIDLPGVNTAGNQNTSGTAAGLSATLAVGSGGTGATSLTANGILVGNGSSAVSAVDMSTKGHLIAGDGSGNPSALSIGTNTHVLTADSSEATGMKWAAVSTPTPTAITVADESTDTSCFPLFVTAATGDLGPKTASGLTFNSNTDVLSGTFAGNITGNVTGNTSGSSGSCTGNAATATALETARNIGGVSFDGTGNINLPGVNTAGNQDTSGTAAVATTVTITDNESTNEDNALIFTSGGDVDGGNIGLESDGTCTYNPSTGKITATGFIGALTGNASGSSGSCTGNAATATSLETARNIGGVSFNGTANIDLPGVNSAGNQNTSGTAAGLSATLAVGSGGTGATSLTANGVIIGNGTSALTSVDMSTKGGLLVGDGSGNPSVLAVGSNDQVLTADSSTATGLKFAAVSGGGGGGLAVLSAVNNYDSTSYFSSYSYTGFGSSYDNYLVLIHAISSTGSGELKLEFLDDGSDLPDAAYRYAAYGKDSNGTDRILTGNNAAAFQLFDDNKTGDNTPMSGYMYFHNGRGGRWDSDSSDSEGNVRPSVQWQIGGKDGNNYHRVAQGSGHYDNTAANTCNGFKLVFTANANKVCLTIYGIKRS